MPTPCLDHASRQTVSFGFSQNRNRAAMQRNRWLASEASARRIAVFLFTLLGFQREAMSSFTCSSGPLFTPRRLDLPCCIPLLE